MFLFDNDYFNLVALVLTIGARENIMSHIIDFLTIKQNKKASQSTLSGRDIIDLTQPTNTKHPHPDDTTDTLRS